MVSLKQVTKPVRPVQIDETQEKFLKKSMKLYKNKRFLKAAKSFMAFSKLFSSTSKQSKASAHAMISNSYKMRARNLNPKQTKQLLEKALEHLDLSLNNEPYWAEYLESKGRIERFIHQKFGCEASFDGKVWQTRCYKVSRALGLFGVSPGMTARYECSICSKDVALCEHLPGQIYDGRVALNVARDIEFDHLSIVNEPRQIGTYIFPRPLTAEMLRHILPLKLAEDIITFKKPLTCKDLLKAILRHRLGGIYWRPRQ